MDVLFRPQRFLFEKDTTIGMWKIRETFHCWTLEDAIRSVKIKKETAIPSGVYEIALEVSPKFGLIPTIKDVKNFDYIRVHGGNTKEDTEGCPLVGYTLETPTRISNCKPALDKIIETMKANGGKGIISIEGYAPPIPEAIGV